MSCNVIKEYTEFKKTILTDYTKKMMGTYYNEEIFLKYLDKYINVRYYNLESEVRATLELNLNHYLNEIYEKDKNVVSEFIFKLFKLYYYIDDVVEFDYQKSLANYVKTLNKIREEKVGIKEPIFIEDFSKLLTENQKKQTDYINSFDTHEFYLDFKQIPNKDIYDVKLKYEIQIPKLYSRYAIRKVWETTMISENKIKVEYYLLNQKILKDIIEADYNKNYLVDFKSTLFTKENDLKKTLEIFNNDIGKDLLTMKITYEDFIQNKEKVLTLIKEGYQFALIIDEKYSKSTDNKNIIDIFKYIISNNKEYLTEALKSKRNLIILE